jgi:ribonuclease HI
MKKVLLISDGSCLGNPGPGGWACILRFGSVKKEFFGCDPHTTNNRMEQMAPIQGLLAASPKGTLRGRDHDRLRVRTSWDHKVDRQMEAEAVVEKA